MDHGEIQQPDVTTVTAEMPSSTPTTGEETLPAVDTSVVSEGDTVEGEKSPATVREQLHSPDQIQEIRRNEAQRVVHTHIAREGYQATKIKPKDWTDSQAAAYGYYFLSSDIMNLPIGRLDKPYPLQGGNPLFVSNIRGANGSEYRASGPDGQKVTAIVEKIDLNGKTILRCVVDNDEVDILADELLNAQLLAEENVLHESFTQGSTEDQVFNAYLTHLKDRESIVVVADDTLREASHHAGLLDAEALRGLIKNAVPEGPQRETLLMTLSDQIVANPETAGQILAGLNNTEGRISQLTGLIETNEQAIQNVRTQLAGITDTTEGAAHLRHQLEGQIAAQQAEIANFKSEQVILQKLQEQLPDGENGMIKLVLSMYDGTMDDKQAQRVSKALQTGDMDKLLVELIGGLPQESEKRKKYDGLLQAARYGGMGALAILLLMFMRAANEQ